MKFTLKDYQEEAVRANDIARIARTHIDRIHALLEDPTQSKARAAFEAFAEELRDDLNDSVSDDEVVEMLAQHLITKPVFDALFADYSFAGQNPISRAMEGVKVDKASGIVNDANDWARETMHNPRYPLELLLRVVTVSLETMKIVKALPALVLEGE